MKDLKKSIREVVDTIDYAVSAIFGRKEEEEITVEVVTTPSTQSTAAYNPYTRFVYSVNH